ncbi:MAG: hypothetical protein M3O50_04440 [Myxococcota bacterium]|nr:hypothetical protein [Myxococcota bacterium]
MIARFPPTAAAGERGGVATGWFTDAALLVAAKLALGFWVLHQGFSHISDDDYARTVIAEQFARAPRLDPSGTSWLPLPFWLEGTAMILLGRSLSVARGVALAVGAASVAAPYLAMRSARVRRGAAIIATAAALGLPWNAWLGVATVPEGWAGALTAAGAIAMATQRAQPWAGAALLGAALCRYEAWPACAIMAALCSWQALDAARARRSVWHHARCALLATAGPISWMAWNEYAHGSALHFLSRVSAFRRAIGAADVSLLDKLLGYPRALAEETPEVLLLGGIGIAGLVAWPTLRDRWSWAMAAVVATDIFLVAGDLGDGAPTHHAARALAGTWWILVGMGVDAIFTSSDRAAVHGPVRAAIAITAAALAGTWCAFLPARWSDSPGRGRSERRDAQALRGLELRERGVSNAEITPCSFEHFALIAAWGEPERAVVLSRTGSAPTEDCPRVEER